MTVKRQTYHTRIKNGMDPERAAAMPVRRQNKIKARYKKIAEQNGIKYHTLYYRIKTGMDPRMAATLPVQEQGIVKHYEQKAAENGIKLSTFRARYYSYGYSLEESATTPRYRKLDRKVESPDNSWF